MLGNLPSEGWLISKYDISVNKIFAEYISVNTIFQLADTVVVKKNYPLIGGVHLLEISSILVLISRLKHFSISIKCSWVD